MKLITLEAIELKATELMEMRHTYLRQQGWEYKCDTPGSCWLWQKQIDARTVLCNEVEAFSLQEYMEILST
jgi:hypothetical protein